MSIVGIAADDHRMVTVPVDYDIPSAVLGWPAEAMIHKMHKYEADTILAHMQGRMEP